MPEANCFCDHDHICLPCYHKEMEEEYQAWKEFMDQDGYQDDAEELPF